MVVNRGWNNVEKNGILSILLLYQESCKQILEIQGGVGSLERITKTGKPTTFRKKRKTWEKEILRNQQKVKKIREGKQMKNNYI